jgi:hypothetical protein
LTVNSYLLHLGISDVSVFKARFVLAGTTVLFLAGAGFLVPAFCFSEYLAQRRQHRDSEPTLRSQFGSIVYIAGCLLPLLIFLFISLPHEGTLSDFVQALLGSLLLYVLCLFGGTLGWFLPTFVRAAGGQIVELGTSEDEYLRAKRKIAPYVGSALVFFSLLGFVWFYSIECYPRIPQQLCGGKSRMVKLLVKPEATKALEELGLCFGKDGESKDQLPLVYEGDSSYVFLLKKDRYFTISLDRALVFALKDETPTPIRSR